MTVIRWTMNKYGNQNYYKNILALSDDKSKLENLDPFNLPSGITTRIIDGKSVANGMVVSEEFTGIEFYKDWYFTVVSYTRNHLYTTGNTIGKIRLRHNSEPEIQNNIISKIYLDHNSSRVFTLHYSDPDGDALTVTTDPGSSAGSWHDDGAGTLTFSVNGNGAPAGSYTASVMVSDGVATVSSYIYYTEDALRAAKDDIMLVANKEGLTAHANAIAVRFEEE